MQGLTAKQSKLDDPHKDELAMLKAQLTQHAKQQSAYKDEKMESEENLHDQIKGLEGENNRLRKELQSFDLEFFEQLEDLKFNYSEAKKKLTIL